MKKIKLCPSGKEIAVPEGSTVLAALESHGLMLPNNCRAGACGECKVKVVGGSFDQGFVLDMALSQEERAQGYGLMCMAKPLSDILEIEFSNEDGKPKLFPPRENVSHIVMERMLVTPKILKLRLRSIGAPLRFWPGQYVTLGGQYQKSGEKCPPRPYSIANLPNQDGEIVLFVSKMEKGITSSWIHDDLKVGDRVSLDGPYGTFIGDSRAETPVLCLAAGSGLAPILSLASAAMLRGGFRFPATVLFSAKSENDLFELGTFAYLETKFRNFQFQYTLTGGGKPSRSSNAFQGRIPQVLENHYKDLSPYSIYIAGGPEFVQDCKNQCLKLGANPQNLHVEGFHSSSKH